MIIVTTAILDTNTNQYIAIFRCPYCNVEWKFYSEDDIEPGCNHEWNSITYNAQTKEVEVEFK